MACFSPGLLSFPDCGGLMRGRDSGSWSAPGGWGGGSQGPGYLRWCELTSSLEAGHQAPEANPGSLGSLWWIARPGVRGPPVRSRGWGCLSSAGLWRRCSPRSETACHYQRSEAWKQNNIRDIGDRDVVSLRLVSVWYTEVVLKCPMQCPIRS